jgi:bacillithiol synthase
VQDFLFPTVCYFGGGAEIAYFAQNSEVYRILDRPVTPILHRQSFTVVEAKHGRTLEKYGLSFTDLFAGMDAVLPRIVDKFIDPNTARIFAEAEEKINTELNRLDQTLSQMDVTLAANLATRRRKIIYHIGALRKKYHFRRAERDETIGRRVRNAFTALMPHGHLQERTLNAASFADRLGPAFIDIIYDSIDLDDKGHRVIYL